MKLLAQSILVMGFILFASGCSTSQQSLLEGVNGGVCNNPKCQCPKPCQCGAGCKCGMDGNSAKMNKES